MTISPPTLSASVRAALDATPIPVEGGTPLRACLIDQDGGWRMAWCFDGGRRKEAFGPVYVSVRAASAACHYLNDLGVATEYRAAYGPDYDKLATHQAEGR